MITAHERQIDRLYGHGKGAVDDSHRGYMNFGLWEDGGTDYARAAERLVERLGELLGLAPGARLVDAACGRGTQDLFLLDRFGDVTIDAVDITARNVELATAQAAARVGAGTVRFHRASATRLPFPDESFTHAICVEAAHHFDTREAYLREAYRVLQPGGAIALADIAMRRSPHGAVEAGLVRAATTLWRIPAVNLVDVDGYRAVVERCGFRLEVLDRVGERTFPGYYRAQRAPARRSELVAARGRFGAAVGAAMNYAAHRVYQRGLLEYLLVRAVKPGRGADGRR